MKQTLAALLFIVPALIACTGSASDETVANQTPSNQSTTVKTENENADNGPRYTMKGLIGVWDWVNTQNGVNTDITFNADGTFYMHGTKEGYDSEKNYIGDWTQNGDNLYLNGADGTEIGVMEIVSIDLDTLKMHIKGAPQNEIMIYARR